MIYVPGLTLALVALWFVLSGHLDPILLLLGGFSVLASLWLSARLELIDRDASPYHRAVQILGYLVWLLVEIVKANLQVIRLIFSSGDRLHPCVARITTTGRSDLARALFANSITLTPGTVTVELEDDRLVVHALSSANAEPVAFEAMDRKAAAAIDGRRARESSND